MEAVSFTYAYWKWIERGFV